MNLLLLKAYYLNASASLTESITYCKKVLDIDSSLLAAKELESLVYTRLGSDDKVLQSISEYLMLDSLNIDIYKRLVLVYLVNKQYDTAIIILNDVIKKGIADIEIYEYLANSYSNAEYYILSNEIYQKCLQLSPEDSEYYFWISNNFVIMKQHQYAIEYLKKYISLNGRQLELAYEMLARVFYQKNDFEKSIETYSKVIELYPNNPRYYIERAWVYSRINNLEPMFEDHRQAYKIDSNYYYSVYYKGAYESHVNNSIKAIYYLNKAITINPSLPDAYSLRGFEYSKIGELRKAKIDLKKAISLDSLYTYAYMYRGEYFRIIDQYDSALVDFKRAYFLDPYDYSTSQNLAIFYSKINNTDSATIFFNKAISLYPNGYYSHWLLGIEYTKQKKYDIAIREIKTASLLNTKNSLIPQDLASVFYQSGEIDSAFFYSEKSYNIDSNNMASLHAMAYASYIKKNYSIAYKYYKQLINKEPNISDFYIFKNTAFAASQIGNNEEAIKYYLKALSISPDKPYALGNLGWIYYLNNDFDNCIYYSLKATKLNSKVYFAMFNSALATLRKGEFEKALELYHKYKELSDHEQDYDYKGTIADLEDLINKGIMVKESEQIIKEVFKN